MKMQKQPKFQAANHVNRATLRQHQRKSHDGSKKRNHFWHERNRLAKAA